MGSTAVGRMFQPLSDPISEWSTRNFDGGAREREYAGKAAREADAQANAMIDKQQADIKQQGMIKERDLARARQRAVMGNAGGRSSTILTQPDAYTGASSNGYTPGRKQLLGM